MTRLGMPKSVGSAFYLREDRATLTAPSLHKGSNTNWSASPYDLNIATGSLQQIHSRFMRSADPD